MLDRLYSLIIRARNRMYDLDLLERHKFGAFTISVGNITTGGTGKTPLVAYIARQLALDGRTVCILSRGYGRRDPGRRVLVSDGQHVLSDPDHSGDEPFELAEALIGKAIVIADADRVAAAEWASRRFEVTNFILDDAFQHRRAGRDLDIVCIDATAPFGGDRLLPAGRLREPLGGLARADVIMITRSDLVESVDPIIDRISQHNEKAAVFTCSTRLTSLSGAPTRGKKGFAFAAVGNPDAFVEGLRRSGVTIAGTSKFRDHHRYSQSDIETIERSAAASHADYLVTTAKDHVKLRDLEIEMPLSVAETDIVVDGSARFEALITASL